MSLLRWTHDHHRDFRARVRAQAHAHSSMHGARDQDRYLMTPSQPTDDRSRRHQSRWSITSNAAGRNNALDSTPRTAPNRIRRTTIPCSQQSSPETPSRSPAAAAPRNPSPLSGRGENPHSPRHSRRTIRRRDFVPWRFSAAGRHGAPLDRHHRRLKTCTRADIGFTVAWLV